MSKYFVVQVSSVLSKEYLIEADSMDAAEKRAAALDLYDELGTYDWVEREIRGEFDVDDPAEVGNYMEVVKADGSASEGGEDA
ncbi:hypothetical protein GCM10009570_25180 [Dietzia natronolimnaea]